MLGEIQREHPETIFLAEAFTRPKVMRHLAKAGFSQSYTYFTWRNTAAELTEYLTELTQTDVREYLRPNLFANTPDILHEYLQHGGRPAFEIAARPGGDARRVATASTAASSCPRTCRSSRAARSTSTRRSTRSGSRNFDQPGNLAELIAQVNAIRREHPALQRDWGLRVPPDRQPRTALLQQAVGRRLRT